MTSAQYKVIVAATLLLSLVLSSASGQVYFPGEIYRDDNAFVEYRAGNLPIILSAPHGGLLRPDSIPDRSCAGCITTNDSYTQSIAVGIYDAIAQRTGCYPHLVINRLHRSKFDANRAIEDAADGETHVEQSWEAYHRYIDYAKTTIQEDIGRGLFVDLHGHAHTIQRMELGYLLSRSTLQSTDAILDDELNIEQSSIRGLVDTNESNLSHADLLRGSLSLGSLVSEQGFPAVPSSDDPAPMGDDPYFTGGYNTARHGSREAAGPIDAIQIEMNQHVRFTDSIRLQVIDSLTEALLTFYRLHYDTNFAETYCEPTTALTTARPSVQLSLFPNPAGTHCSIISDEAITSVTIYDSHGIAMLRATPTDSQRIDLRDLPSGIYFVQIIDKSHAVTVRSLVIQQ